MLLDLPSKLLDTQNPSTRKGAGAREMSSTVLGFESDLLEAAPVDDGEVDVLTGIGISLTQGRLPEGGEGPAVPGRGHDRAAGLPAEPPRPDPGGGAAGSG